MSELRPEIRRLIDLAKSTPAMEDEVAPFGFAARVVANSRRVENGSARHLRQAFSIASWSATLVIVSCGLILIRERTVARPASQLVTATQFFAEHISP